MSILVGRHIRKMLFDSRLADDVNGHIFLDGLNRECDFPFIVYNYTVEPGEGSKDYKTDLCQVSVLVFSKDGEQSINLANDIRAVLEHSKGDYGMFEVTDTIFEGYRGSLEEDVYIRELDFNIKTY